MAFKMDSVMLVLLRWLTAGVPKVCLQTQVASKEIWEMMPGKEAALMAQV